MITEHIKYTTEDGLEFGSLPKAQDHRRALVFHKAYEENECRVLNRTVPAIFMGQWLLDNKGIVLSFLNAHKALADYK